MRCTLPVLLVLGSCEPASQPVHLPSTDTVPTGPLPALLTLNAVDLSMTIDPRADGFSGETDLHVELARSTDTIWMHGLDLAIGMLEARTPSGTPVPGTWTPEGETGTARITFPEPLAAGTQTLHIEWTGQFATDLSGLFRVEERGNAFALAKSESIQARRALPGFDEPRYKAPYRVKLTVPDGYVVIGNGRELSREPAAEGFETVRLAETDPLPTYLLSLAVGPFESVDGPVIPPSPQRSEPIPLRGFARPGRAADLGVTLASTPPLIAILEDAFGLPFPDEKLDIVAAPAWPSGATELAAAITYREARVLLGPTDDDSVDPAARQKMLKTHAHELVHMWFGNLVTPAWWNDLWLKEGFATWGSALALSAWEPNGGHALHATGRKIAAMSTDSLATARAVREPIQGDSDIRNAYDSITYGKGMAILEMVDQGYGPNVFRPAVRSWLEETAGSSTDTASFVRALVQASGRRELGATLTSFLDQAGVPLVSMTLDCPNRAPPSVTLRQQRYRPSGSRINDQQLWTIPICLQVDTLDEPVCTVLQHKDMDLSLPGERCPRLIRPNPGGHGYYRSALSTGAWNRLAQVLPDLEATEAWMVVDSASAGFDAQKIPAPSILKLYEAAARHPSRHVAAAPLPAIAGWMPHLEPKTKALVQDWARSVWQPLRLKAARSSAPDQRLLEATVLQFEALVIKDPQARLMLTERLAQRIDGNLTALPSSAYEAALQVLAEERGSAGIEPITAAVVALDDPALERAVLTAPGHFTDPQQRIEAFDSVLRDDLDPRVAFARVASLMATQNASRRDDIRSRIEQDWQRLAEAIPRQWRRNMPRLWAGSACSRNEAEALDAWFRTEAATQAPGHERTLAQTLEQVELCTARHWLESSLAATLSN